jgi:poly(hydroxyalkanoate) granule-associated protein
MANTVIIEEEIVEEQINITELAQKALHLGLGAIALAQDEVMALFEKAQKELKERLDKTQGDATGLMDKMVDRGVTVEEDGRERVNKFMDARRKQVKGSVKDVQGGLESRIESVLHTMNVPTKGDMDRLEKKINTLTKKINELSKAKQAN